MSQPDLRGFNYALEPLQRKHEWQLELQQLRLAEIQKKVVSAEEALEKKRQEHADNLVLAEELLQKRLDPASYRSCLAYLVKLCNQLQEAQDQLIALCKEREVIREKCLVEQQTLETLNAHRKEELEAFVVEQAGKLSAEADSDWLSRYQRKRLQNASAFFGTNG